MKLVLILFSIFLPNFSYGETSLIKGQSYVLCENGPNLKHNLNMLNSKLIKNVLSLSHSTDGLITIKQPFSASEPALNNQSICVTLTKR